MAATFGILLDVTVVDFNKPAFDVMALDLWAARSRSDQSS